MTQAELLAIHAGDSVGFEFRDHVGYAVVRRDAGPPGWVGGGRMTDAALYVRRDRGRPSEDFGPGALLRVAPLDEWARATAEEESCYFVRHPPSCWTGGFLSRVGGGGGPSE